VGAIAAKDGGAVFQAEILRRIFAGELGINRSQL